MKTFENEFIGNGAKDYRRNGMMKKKNQMMRVVLAAAMTMGTAGCGSSSKIENLDKTDPFAVAEAYGEYLMIDKNTEESFTNACKLYMPIWLHYEGYTETEIENECLSRVQDGNYYSSVWKDVKLDPDGRIFNNGEDREFYGTAYQELYDENGKAAGRKDLEFSICVTYEKEYDQWYVYGVYDRHPE